MYGMSKPRFAASDKKKKHYDGHSNPAYNMGKGKGDEFYFPSAPSNYAFD